MKPRTIEWLNQNGYRVYPFVENSSMALLAGGSLPLSAILDFSIVTTLVAFATPPRLQSFLVGDDGVTFNFSGAQPFSIEVPVAAAFPYTATGSTDGIYFKCTFGPGCTQLMALPHLTYYMTTAPVIEPALVISQIKLRVDSIQAIGVDQDKLTGVIWMEAGYNCDPVVAANFIRFSVAPGRGAGQYCEPLTDDVLSCRDAFLWWNSQNASADGNYLLGAGIGLEVENVAAENLIIFRAIKRFESLSCT